MMVDSDQSARLPPFNPFRAIPYLKRMERWPSWSLLLMTPCTFAILILVTLADGTLGGASDFQPVADVRRALDRGGAEPSEPHFPLLRDFPNLYLVLVICLTAAAIHWQWKLMAGAILKLQDSGALEKVAEPKYRTIHKILRVPQVVGGSPSADPAVALLLQMNKWLDRLGRSSGLLVAISFIMALLTALGPNQNGLFRAFAGSVPDGGMQAWLTEAYDSWWGSIGYPAGFMTYVLLMTLGIFLVLIQSVVGLIALYTVNALNAVARYDLDWLNRDGKYGWRSINATFRTVILSLVLHGSALSVSLIAFGLENVPWLIGVVAIWLIMLPSFTLGPRVAFKGLAGAAKARRIDELVAELERAGPTIDKQELLRSRIESIRSVQARPLQLRPAEVPAFVALILLPICLTAVQVYFTVIHGR